MTELSFLLELLMEHRLEKRTKIMLKNRIAEIQVQVTQNPYPHIQNRAIPINGSNQAPSMAQKIADFEAERGIVPPHAIVPQGTQQGMSPGGAQALLDRQKLINQAVSGKEEQGRTSPRKF